MVRKGNRSENKQPVYNAKGQRICGQQRRGKPKGVVCQRIVSEEFPRCKDHGLSSMKKFGPAHHNYRHGRYSNVNMPARMMERYKENMTTPTPERMSLMPELAVVDSLLQERLETLQDGGSADKWKDVRREFNGLEAAITGGDLAGIRSGLVTMREAINAGASEAAARGEVLQLIKDRKGLVESITKQATSMRQVVTVEQSIAVMVRIVDLVERNVSDKQDRSLVLQGIASLASLPEGAK